MKITFDPAKRKKNLAERGLDFVDAETVFAGPILTQKDDRTEYGETRFQTYGLIKGHLILVVWTPRIGTRHIISMRKCNDREKAKITHRLVKA